MIVFFRWIQCFDFQRHFFSISMNQPMEDETIETVNNLKLVACRMKPIEVVTIFLTTMLIAWILIEFVFEKPFFYYNKTARTEVRLV